MIKQDQRKLLWFTVMLCLSLQFFLFLPLPPSPALPTHHSCFPYRVLLTIGGGCKRCEDVKPQACVTSPLQGEANCLSFLMSCFRSERKRNWEWEWRRNINRKKKKEYSSTLFLDHFCSRSILERIATTPCLMESSPSALCCLSQGCCGVLICTFPLPRGSCPWPCPPYHLLFFQHCWDSENKLYNINTSALGSPMVPFTGASAKIFALSLHKFRRSCLWDSLPTVSYLILNSKMSHWGSLAKTVSLAVPEFYL